MSQYFIHQAEAVFGFDHPVSIRIKNDIIDDIGDRLVAMDQDIVIDASQCVIYPGFVNTHHHLAQSILKGVPAGLNQGLGEWLASVPYQFWPHITPEHMYAAAKLGLYEQLRSGVTTCADHHEPILCIANARSSVIPPRQSTQTSSACRARTKSDKPLNK